VRIPDGDLVPRRRRSRYGGGYGRRRRSRTLAAVVVVVTLVVGLGYWFGVRDEEQLATLAPCPTASPSPSPTPAPTSALPPPRQVRLALLNGTPRNGLAHTVAAGLRSRGFVVLSEGNASAALGGASTVSYGPGALGPATVLRQHVHGARLVSAPKARAGSVVLILGGDYRRLSTAAEVTAQATPTGRQVAVPARTQEPCSP